VILICYTGLLVNINYIIKCQYAESVFSIKIITSIYEEIEKDYVKRKTDYTNNLKLKRERKQMKNSNSMIIFTVFFTLLLASSAFSYHSLCFSSDVTAEDIKRIAEDGKDEFLAGIMMEYLVKYGKTEIPETPLPETPIKNFHDLTEANIEQNQKLKSNPVVVLGDPFIVYTIQTEDLLNYNESVDLSFILIPTKWFVPVYIHKKPRAMLSVGYMHDKWQVVGIGLGDYSEFEHMDKESSFVRMHQTPADFIITKINGKKMIYPFSMAKKFMKLDDSRVEYAGHYNVSEFMSKLTNIVKSEITR